MCIVVVFRGSSRTSSGAVGVLVARESGGAGGCQVIGCVVVAVAVLKAMNECMERVGQQ